MAPIPFGPSASATCARYARRHYGIDDYHLTRSARGRPAPVGDEHGEAGVPDTFAPNRPDAELGELPGVCTHYVIDPRGPIFQLVSRRIMCRHTVGLNHLSFGIEHVGRREADVFGASASYARRCALVRWLRDRYGIRIRDVIGHNESLRSPYHRERVRRLRRQTHADFPRRVARRYRGLLEGD